jgi:hypothetical protein
MTRIIRPSDRTDNLTGHKRQLASSSLREEPSLAHAPQPCRIERLDIRPEITGSAGRREQHLGLLAGAVAEAALPQPARGNRDDPERRAHTPAATPTGAPSSSEAASSPAATAASRVS